MSRLKLFTLFVAAIFLFPITGAVHAQIPPLDDITVNVTPENPSPDQQVVLTVQSYSVDTKTANIEWSVDGRMVAKGTGVESYTLTTKKLGVSTSVMVVIVPLSGISVTKNLVITPMSVDLLWQANDSIVPPFYRGRALPTSESSVKVVAIPQIVSSSGVLLSPVNFFYGWKEQFNEDQANSGYGKNSFNVDMDYLNPTNYVDVSISGPDGAVMAVNEEQINPVSPQILWYASNPLYGPIFNNALSGSYAVKGPEDALLAEPYFFSPDVPGTTTTYEWSINGEGVNTPPTPNLLNLLRSGSSTGTATIDLTTTNTSKLFQQSTAHLDLLLQ